MPRAKRTIETNITIDGVALVWRLHREQQFTDAEELRGISIHVKTVEGTRRELILEYPGFRSQKAGFIKADPGRPTIVAAKVEADIKAAIAEGWDPASRGKPFIYYLDELPN
jgi:hypothetical protein